MDARLRYREIDPNVFGEELGKAAYSKVDRIAVVAALIEMPSPTIFKDLPMVVNRLRIRSLRAEGDHHGK